jgi:ADP-ribose pyrophosphatase YjhB (NUDIX family)
MNLKQEVGYFAGASILRRALPAAWSGWGATSTQAPDVSASDFAAITATFQQSRTCGAPMIAARSKRSFVRSSNQHEGDMVCTESMIQQSGIIPFRIRRGQLEIALVTASGGRGWTIPKGHIEDDMTPADSAAKEAFEEAGLTGEVFARPESSYSYEKHGRMRRVTVYAMQVRETLVRWPEMSQRKRAWLGAELASSRVRHPELRCCLQAFAKQFRQRRLAA